MFICDGWVSPTNWAHMVSLIMHVRSMVGMGGQIKLIYIFQISQLSRMKQLRIVSKVLLYSSLFLKSVVIF